MLIGNILSATLFILLEIGILHSHYTHGFEGDWQSSHDNTSNTSFIQQTRKALKKVRKWQTAHKAEVALAKCTLKYFKVRTPEIGIRRSNDYFDLKDLMSTDDSKGRTTKISSDQVFVDAGFQRMKFGTEDGNTNKLANLSRRDGTAVQTDMLIDTGFNIQAITAEIRTAWSSFINYVYKPLIGPILEHKLVSCVKDYTFAKFWAWVDSAPD